MTNAEKYIKVVEKKVVDDLSNAFPNGSGVFSHDSAPCHEAKQVMAYIKKIKITVLDGPGNPPDLIPIENLWSIITLQLRSEDCITKAKLMKAIIRMWYRN